MFKKFLETLTTEENQSLIESIMDGYSVLFESEFSNNVKYIHISENDMDEEENIDHLYSQVDSLVTSSSINVLRGKDLNCIAVIDDTVVGALFIEFINSKFSFDVIVAKDNQSSGIGKELTSIAMNEYDIYSDIDDVKLELDVVNSQYAKFLINKYNLHIVYDNGGHIILTDKLDVQNLHEVVSKVNANKELIVVDIQPEYESYMGFKPYHFTDFLNKNYKKFSKITLLYNGEDTLGMTSKSEYIMWLIENGLDEEIINELNFFDKGYNFFRNAMDKGIDHDEIVRVIAYMAKKDVNDSRMLTDELWDDYLKLFPNDTEIVDYLRNNEDSINIPDLIDELNDASNNIIVTGGGKDECLAEVLIALKYLGKKYTLLNKFVY